MAGEWIDVLALGPIYRRYNGTDTVTTNPTTFLVNGGYYHLKINIPEVIGPSGLLPNATPTKMRMAGKVTASPSASGSAYLGNGYVDLFQTAALSSGTVTITSGELDVGPDPYFDSSVVIGIVSISPGQSVTFEITQFDVYIETEDPPTGNDCFWTNKVGVREVCDSTPAENWLPDFGRDTATSSPGLLLYREFVCDTDLFSAISAGGTDLQLTHYELRGGPSTVNGWACGSGEITAPNWTALSEPLPNHRRRAIRLAWVLSDIKKAGRGYHPGLPSRGL